MPTKSKVFEAFCRGALESLSAHLMAWASVAFIERVFRFAGHVIVAIGAGLLQAFIR